MRVEDVRAWLCEQLDVAPESMVSVNDLWMNYLDQFDGNLRDRQMAYWKSLGCPYDHYNHMEEWWGGYMNAWPRIAELRQELASYVESDGNLRKKVEELEAKLEKMHVAKESLIQDAKDQSDRLTHKIAELEAQIKHKDEVMLKQTKLNTRVINEKMALVDGLRELADSWDETDGFLIDEDCAKELRALLNKEKDDV